jgi:sugar (pentulose or hexulose) kinase
MTQSAPSLIAVFDVGKTNAKLSLLDAHDGSEVWQARRANQSRRGIYGAELDVAALEDWVLDALCRAPSKERITHLVPVSHGAAAVLVDEDGRVLSAPDYEDPICESVSAEYDALRDAFEHTFSPSLPLGLNLGRQLFYLQRSYPQLFWRTAKILLYPQYWAWRFSGQARTEVTSLGCHTDLWRPEVAQYSALVERQGWLPLFPARSDAAHVIGAVLPEIIARCELAPTCKVTCGIHDSNASYLKFLIGREHEPFTVVSSGTWTVAMANRGALSNLVERKDMLANVNAFGQPVPTARYMGGREYEAIARGLDPPTLEGLRSVIRQRAFALPAFAAAGPFRGSEGMLIRAENLSGVERASLATLYAAAMTSLLIASLGAHTQSAGEILIDGPLASNALFGPLLAALTGSRVQLQTGEVGGARAALFLAGQPVSKVAVRPINAIDLPELNDYYVSWREQACR